jgi:hypothetical protein
MDAVNIDIDLKADSFQNALQRIRIVDPEVITGIVFSMLPCVGHIGVPIPDISFYIVLQSAIIQQRLQRPDLSPRYNFFRVLSLNRYENYHAQSGGFGGRRQVYIFRCAPQNGGKRRWQTKMGLQIETIQYIDFASFRFLWLQLLFRFRPTGPSLRPQGVPTR